MGEIDEVAVISIRFLFDIWSSIGDRTGSWFKIEVEMVCTGVDGVTGVEVCINDEGILDELATILSFKSFLI